MNKLEAGMLALIGVTLAFFVGSFGTWLPLNRKIESLYAAIAHGDSKHRLWLKLAIEAHFAGKPLPEEEP